jgi:trigger factor
MQVTETLKDGLKRGYEIKIGGADIETRVSAKLQEAQPGVAMKGFRKGKVPMALLKKQFGARLLGEAMQEAVDEAMKSHFAASGDKPAMQPEMKMTNENWKEGDDITVALTYEALPEIPEADLAKIKLEKLIVEAGEADIDEALQNLAATATTYADRKEGAKAKDGDQVVIDFVGKIGGEPFQGGKGEDHPLVLGSNSFIPGFENQLVGVKAGEAKTVSLSFPEDYRAQHLAGKAAEFDVNVKAVKEPVDAKIDDELAKQFGAEDLAALKGQVKDRLEAEYQGAARSVMKRALLDALDKAVKFELPPTLVAAEANQIAHQLWHEEHPDHQGHDHDAIEPTDEHKSLAERRVRLGLLLAEIGRKAEVKVTDAEFTNAIMAEARRYGNQARAFIEQVQKNAALRQNIQAPIFEDKVVDHIFGIAKVTEKKVSKDDLKQAVDALDEL